MIEEDDETDSAGGQLTSGAVETKEEANGVNVEVEIKEEANGVNVEVEIKEEANGVNVEVEIGIEVEIEIEIEVVLILRTVSAIACAVSDRRILFEIPVAIS